MSTRQELEKWLDYKLDQLIKQFGYADIIDASPQEIMTQLSLKDRLEYKKLIDNLVRRNEITLIDHHSKNNQSMILINRTEHHDEPMRDTGLRFCLVPTGDGKTFESVRHMTHSDKLKCQPYDRSLWATKTTRQYNKNPIKEDTQTHTPDPIKINSQSVSAGYRGVAKVPTPQPTTADEGLVKVTYPNKDTELFIKGSNGYLYSPETGLVVCKNDPVSVEAYWLSIRKPRTRFDRPAAKQKMIYINGEAELFWMYLTDRGLYDEYGVLYGYYPHWYARLWTAFKSVMIYCYSAVMNNMKQTREARRQEAYERKHYQRRVALRQKEKIAKEQRNLNVYGSHRSPYSWIE